MITDHAHDFFSKVTVSRLFLAQKFSHISIFESSKAEKPLIKSAKRKKYFCHDHFTYKQLSSIKVTKCSAKMLQS